ncbi:MAG: AAA family ATPase, partial [Ginsengibacter sp.]
MSKAIYITSSEANSGKSVITLGLMNILLGKLRKIAYFKPVIMESVNNKKDINIETMIDHFGLDISYNDCYAFTYSELLKFRSENNSDFVIDTIISKYKKLEDSHDFVLVDGMDFEGDGASFEFSSNVEIAKNLSVPLILVAKSDGYSPSEITRNVLSTMQILREKEVPLLAVIANKLDPLKIEELHVLFSKLLPKDVLSSIIPFARELKSPTMKEIVEGVGGKVLFGQNYLSNPVDHFIVGAMQLQNCLTHLKENTLIVTPGDRGDIILAMIQANLSKNYPKVAGLVFSGGLVPDEPIIKLLEGLETLVPMVQVQTGTFETVNKVASVKPRIYPENNIKIDFAIATFEKNI